jgi:chemotaxis protein methyltransferase CheR
VSDPREGAPALDAVAQVLADEAGLSFAGPLAATLREALLAAAAERGASPGRFAAAVAGRDPAAVDLLVEHAVVRETAFWRHPEQLELFGRLTADAEGPLAIWSAGCATGEEPHSLAMVLLERGRGGVDDRIVATDLSARALAEGRRGLYGPHSVRKLPLRLAERWLEPAGGEGARRVHAAVKARVRFERHNLVRDSPPAGGPFDVVVSRNVLIYFDAAVAAAVLLRLAAALAPGGVLLLGPVEQPLAAGVPLEWEEDGGVAYLRKPRC